jgi:two-component system, sensor histidine kinase and response regulator
LTRLAVRYSGEKGIHLTAKQKVLVIDDEPSVRFLIEDMLDGAYHVFLADSAETAREIWRKENLFSIICDVNLGTDDGLKVLAKIQAEKPKALVIMMSGSDDKEKILTALRLNAFDYLVKPFGSFEILRSLERAKQHAKLRNEKIALNISKESVAEVVEKNFHGIIVTDTEGRILYLNSAIETMFGRPRTDLLEQLFGIVVGSQAAELDIFRNDGTTGIAEIRRVETTWDGKRANLIMMHDITEKKDSERELIAAREKALAASTAKSAFLSNMSHEIRTPLNAIIGTASLAETSESLEEAINYNATIRSAGDALLSIINDILDFSKIEAGMMSLEENAFEIKGLIAEIFDIFAATVSDKDLELISHLSFEIPEMLIGDRGRIRQILFNLIGNSVKFTSDGEVNLSCELVSRDEALGKILVRFEIEDTGIGISKQEQKKLFHAFYQAEGGRTKQFPGTGLGLSLCRKVVELMGGKIGCESAQEKGSRFFFEVSFGLAGEQPEIGQTDRFKGKSALMIIDHKTTRETMLKNLVHWGFSVDSCCGYEDVLSNINKTDFDVIIIQKELAEADGLVVAEELLKSYPCFQGKLILLHRTKSQYRGLSARAKKMGFFCCLSRPLVWKSVYESLAALVLGSERTGANPDLQKWEGGLNPEEQRKILIVDDNPGNQKVCKKMIEKCGHLAQVATGGREAVRAAREGGFALILMDVQMPGMNGFEATLEIRKLPKPRCDVIIVALTASVFDDAERKCLDSNMDAYLPKPAKLRDIASCLQRWLPSAEERLQDRKVVALPKSRESMPQICQRIDLDTIGELLELSNEEDPNFFRNQVGLFFTQSQDLIAGLFGALKRDDFPKVSVLAHHLAGVFGIVGGKRAFAQCLEIERYTSSKTPEPCEVERLAEELRLEQQFVNEFLRKQLAIESLGEKKRCHS